jgi:F0F1-type ATP synthase assembly protein I
MDWGTRITTIGLEFGLPAVLGYGLDRWWHTAPWLTIAGAVSGLLIGMMHVLRLPQELARSSSLRRPGPPSKPADRDPGG